MNWMVPIWKGTEEQRDSHYGTVKFRREKVFKNEDGCRVPVSQQGFLNK